MKPRFFTTPEELEQWLEEHHDNAGERSLDPAAEEAFRAHEPRHDRSGLAAPPAGLSPATPVAAARPAARRWAG